MKDLVLFANLSFLSIVLSLGAFAQGDSIVEKCAHQAVFNNDFYRRTLYTWTTKSQIKRLRNEKVLLIKSKSDRGQLSVFDESLRSEDLSSNPIAQLLLEEQFEKKRFAWTNAWSTARGFKGESYGDQLIKIDLKPEALIGIFDPSRTEHPFQFYNNKGEMLTEEYVVQHQQEIAAVYHLNFQAGIRKRYKMKYTGTIPHRTDKTTSYKTRISFREFVVLNESMIEKWSYGTDEILKEIELETALMKYFEKSNYATENAMYYFSNSWQDGHSTESRDFDTFHHLRCFINDYYLFHPSCMKKIEEKLETAKNNQPNPIIVE